MTPFAEKRAPLPPGFTSPQTEATKMRRSKDEGVEVDRSKSHDTSRLCGKLGTGKKLAERPGRHHRGVGSAVVDEFKP